MKRCFTPKTPKHGSHCYMNLPPVGNSTAVLRLKLGMGVLWAVPSACLHHQTNRPATLTFRMITISTRTPVRTTPHTNFAPRCRSRPFATFPGDDDDVVYFDCGLIRLKFRPGPNSITITRTRTRYFGNEYINIRKGWGRIFHHLMKRVRGGKTRDGNKRGKLNRIGAVLGRGEKLRVSHMCGWGRGWVWRKHMGVIRKQIVFDFRFPWRWATGASFGINLGICAGFAVCLHMESRFDFNVRGKCNNFWLRAFADGSCPKFTHILFGMWLCLERELI